MTVTKAGLIDAICESCDFPKKLSLTTVESLLETVKKTLSSGEDIMISGFGKFCVKDKKERRGRNPQSGENLMLEGRRVVTFKCSNLLRDQINGKN